MIGDPLDLPLRKRIYDFVRINPGAHFRQIQRVLDLAVGQLDFHLNALVKGEVLVKQIESGNARFYVRDKFSGSEKTALSVLRRRIPRNIVLYLLENGESTPGDMLEDFSISNGTLSYHLGRLEKADVLIVRAEGRKRHYSLKEPDVMEMLLVMFRSSLLDQVVDTIA